LSELVSGFLALARSADLRRRRCPVRALRGFSRNRRGAVQLLADELDDDLADEIRDRLSQLGPDDLLEPAGAATT
jgi:hypothetical protein